ncbi:MAG: type II secretion system F family protein [Anaerolineales bacterium]
MAGTTGAAWLFRESLHQLVTTRGGLIPAAVAALVVWLAVGGLVLIIRSRLMADQLRERTSSLTGLDKLKPKPMWRRWLDQLPDPLEWLLQPVLRTSWGRRRTLEWRQAGLGERGSRFLLLLLTTALAAGFLGAQLGGSLLAVAFACIAPLAPYRWVAGRAQERRRLFSEQIPAALDALAAGVSAGLSFQQSIRYAMGELPQPVADSMASVDRKILLGHPVEGVLLEWAERYPDEGLVLAVDGILLQRQMGGDLVGMLQRTADIARERIELQREVHAVTAQGRLSGWVIAGLVPVSAALLLSSNPQYINVLFDTLVGQLLLVIALLLQLIGWFVISRLIRVTY